MSPRLKSRLRLLHPTYRALLRGHRRLKKDTLSGVFFYVLSLFYRLCRSAERFFYFVKLLGGKSCLGNRDVALGEAEVGELVVTDADDVADLIPIIVGIQGVK